MTPHELLYAFGEIDERHLELSAKMAVRARKHRRCRRIALAALCVVLSVSWCLWLAQQEKPLSIVYPDENAPHSPMINTHSVHQVEYYDLADMAAMADTIVCGDVLSSESLDTNDGYRILCAEITVREVIKGNVSIRETLRVKDYAIEYVDDHGESVGVAGVGPLMERGNRVLLFLNSYEDLSNTALTHYITLGAEGKFFFDRDGKYHCTAQYESPEYLSGTMLIGYNKSKTLDEIKEEIG